MSAVRAAGLRDDMRGAACPGATARTRPDRIGALQKRQRRQDEVRQAVGRDQGPVAADTYLIWMAIAPATITGSGVGTVTEPQCERCKAGTWRYGEGLRSDLLIPPAIYSAILEPSITAKAKR
ncbi:hypothetical protein NDU88_003798 [Pleurodeles waltl]|uniref:Uncharacterized protein n=1 Tax=Pleurodeles waltl TaxID=8319 RepID=A0AAV7WTA6_PLEWA|nr:hypothetical protein NDU88_003798 [Pleurodeles waltl]